MFREKLLEVFGRVTYKWKAHIKLLFYHLHSIVDPDLSDIRKNCFFLNSVEQVVNVVEIVKSPAYV